MTEGDCCSPSRGEGSKKLMTSDGLAPSLAGMSHVATQEFSMGSDSQHIFPTDFEGPVRVERVDEFWIDNTATTNAEFRSFVHQTGYVTEAEKFGWSYVFEGLITVETAKKHIHGRAVNPSWWLAVNGANWAHPFGPDSECIDDHPVVHVSFNDANAYASWLGKRLPTEVEWECAARGGLHQKIYPWGDDFLIEGKPGANIWQGDFPKHNSLEDGFLATAPADSFEPNNYGLFNMVGNVWEWTSSEWSGQQVLKGGSYLCHDSYCNRYRVSARIKNTPESSLSHTGFRLVY